MLIAALFITLTLSTNNRVDGAPNDVTYTTTSIPISDSELISPLRGLYQWRGEEHVSEASPSKDAYERYFWSDLEKFNGTSWYYDFSSIEADIQSATALGKKFGFRIRSMQGYNQGCADKFVPSYLYSYGWCADYTGNGVADTYIPDWNSAEYLTGVADLFNALGDVYDGDPRISWIDIGMYGQYGEFTISSSIDYAGDANNTGGYTNISDGNLNTIVDSVVNNFIHTQSLISISVSHRASMDHAFANVTVDNPIGWRVDCMGQDGYFNQWAVVNRFDPYVNRWQVAPIINEFCTDVAPSSSSGSFATALDQSIIYHVSAIGNGNIPDPMSSFSAQEKADALLLMKTLGYRIQLNSVTLPVQVVQSTDFSLSANWSNIGIAPIYEAWQVKYQLRSKFDSTVIWEGNSNLNLNNLLPTFDRGASVDTPINNIDILNVGTAPVGSYDLYVLIEDTTPIGIRRSDSTQFSTYRRENLKLAITGRESDGSYMLGTVDIILNETPTPITTITDTPIVPTSTMIPTIIVPTTIIPTTVIPTSTIIFTVQPTNALTPTLTRTATPIPTQTTTTIVTITSINSITPSLSQSIIPTINQANPSSITKPTPSPISPTQDASNNGKIFGAIDSNTITFIGSGCLALLLILLVLLVIKKVNSKNT